MAGGISSRLAKILYPAPVFILCGLIEIAHHCPSLAGVSALPPPSAVLSAGQELLLSGTLLKDVAASLVRVFSGFSLAFTVSLGLAVLMHRSRWLSWLLSPFIEILRPVPPIAWIPVAITIFGFGDAAACSIIFCGAFYPMFTNFLLGLRSVPSIYLESAKVLGASQWRQYFAVILPHAMPTGIAGLRVGLGFAWMCVVVAEMIAAKSGLGYEIQLNRQLLRLDRVMAGIACIGALGFLMNRGLEKIERLISPWNFAESNSASDEECEEQNGESNLTFALSRTEAENSQSFAIVEVNNLSFDHGNRGTVEDLSLSINGGEITCLVGPSGCGKTTLMRLIAGLCQPRSGSVSVHGRSSMVFQGASLFPWLTIRDNIKFGMVGDLSSFEKDELANKLLSTFKIRNCALRYPQQTSGGQQQRAALARALATRPDILLLDEPFSALDSQVRCRLQEEISRLVASTNLSVVIVTHDIQEAVFLSNRVIVFSAEQMRVVHEERLKSGHARKSTFRESREFVQAVERLESIIAKRTIAGSDERNTIDREHEDARIAEEEISWTTPYPVSNAKS
jgi:ABC-type nitrate/sulfonate/bicarbonate transport system ATPase subunit/ABC-type nitrate/sulfonate/bicarbonate transport system permease component